jgi:hypothetical protein
MYVLILIYGRKCTCIIRNEELKDRITLRDRILLVLADSSLNRGGLIAENCISVCDKSPRSASVLARIKERRKIRCFTPANSDSSLITLGLSPFQTTLFHLTQCCFNYIFNANASKAIPKQNLISNFKRNRLLILWYI